MSAGALATIEDADTAHIAGNVSPAENISRILSDLDSEWLRIRNLTADITKLKAALERETSHGRP